MYASRPRAQRFPMCGLPTGDWIRRAETTQLVLVSYVASYVSACRSRKRLFETNRRVSGEKSVNLLRAAKRHRDTPTPSTARGCWREAEVGERGTGQRRRLFAAREPVLDGRSIVRVAVRGHHRALHELHGHRTAQAFRVVASDVAAAPPPPMRRPRRRFPGVVGRNADTT